MVEGGVGKGGRQSCFSERLRDRKIEAGSRPERQNGKKMHLGRTWMGRRKRPWVAVVLEGG